MDNDKSSSLFKSKKKGNPRISLVQTISKVPSSGENILVLDNPEYKQAPRNDIYAEIWTEPKEPQSGTSLSSTQLFVENLLINSKESEPECPRIGPTTFTINPDNSNNVRSKLEYLPEEIGSAYFGTAGFLRKLADQGQISTSNQRETDKDSIDLSYYDVQGNVLSPKEAYKELSRKFHGTGPGKKRIEKKLLKKSMSSSRNVHTTQVTNSGKVNKAQTKIFGMK